MKKFLVVLVALMFATGAFAQDAAKKGAEFKYSVFGIAYGVMGSQGDLAYDYQHVRVRPMFTASNENVTAVVRLEIDQDFGYVEDAAAADANDPNVGADPGTDNKAVEVKWAYLQVKDFIAPNLTATTGLKDYYYPMVVDNDFAMTTFAYDFGMGSATLGYIKLVEDSIDEVSAADVNQSTDAQIYVADVTIKAGAINVRPAIFYFAFSDDPTVLTNYALNVAGDFGMVSFEATAGYMTASDDADLDAADYGYDLAVNVKPAEGITIGLFTTSNTGAKDNGDSIGYYSTLDDLVGAPDGRLFLLEANGVDANGGHQDYYDYSQTDLGYTAYGLTAEGTFDKLAVLVQYGYVVSSEDNTFGDSAIGQEFDAQVSYTVAPATTFFVQASYLMAGDDTFFADDATQYAWGLTTKI